MGITRERAEAQRLKRAPRRKRRLKKNLKKVVDRRNEKLHNATPPRVSGTVL